VFLLNLRGSAPLLGPMSTSTRISFVEEERLLLLRIHDEEEVNDVDISPLLSSDQAQDQLQALLRQECDHYQCVDYVTGAARKEQNDASSICSTTQLQKPPPPSSLSPITTSSSAYSSIVSASSREGTTAMMPNKPDLVHLLAECAFLVTDMRFMQPLVEEEESSIESSSTSSSSSAPEQTPPLLKRVGSVVSFQGIHEEVAASHHQQQQQQQQHEKRQEHQQAELQQQQPPSGEDLAYWRRQMMEWAFLVVQSFEMDREVVAVAFNLLDRYVPLEMSRVVRSSDGVNEDATIMLPPITRDDYQLYAMTCLYTAVKVGEPYPRKLAVEALVAMSRDFYTAHDVIYTERDILKVLQWRVHPPTAMTFARHFVAAHLLLAASSATAAAAAPQDKDHLYAICVKITEMALADPSFLSFHNSTIGLAAVLHAVRLQEERSSCATSVVAASSSSLRCKDLLEALQKSHVLSTTTATSATATTVGEQERVKKNQISGCELEVVYSRLEKLLLSS
jgi:Cyclin, N-terminal domain